LERRFQQVYVGEPSVEDTIAILRGLKERYEAHHKVAISDGALVAAAALSNRYIPARQLPDKAIDLIDEAASRLRMEIDSAPLEIDELRRHADRLKLEELALKKEKDDASKERLAALREQLATVQQQLGELQARWERERGQGGARRERERGGKGGYGPLFSCHFSPHKFDLSPHLRLPPPIRVSRAFQISPGAKARVVHRWTTYRWHPARRASS
jgi:ATP-dependent Clp protease ATP-binding subunit ClpA